jgi:hypothetical protein
METSPEIIRTTLTSITLIMVNIHTLETSLTQMPSAGADRFVAIEMDLTRLTHVTLHKQA